MDSSHYLHPNYRVRLTTERQAKLYTNLLIAKIVIAICFIAGILLLNGYTWKELLFVAAFATSWKLFGLIKKGKKNGQ